MRTAKINKFRLQLIHTENPAGWQGGIRGRKKWVDYLPTSKNQTLGTGGGKSNFFVRFSSPLLGG
jgi:hypothetical protein